MKTSFLSFFTFLGISLAFASWANAPDFKLEACRSQVSGKLNPAELLEDRFSSSSLVWENSGQTVWISCRFNAPEGLEYPLKARIFSPKILGEFDLWVENSLMASSSVTNEVDLYRNQPLEVRETFAHLAQGTVNVHYRIFGATGDKIGMADGLPSIALKNVSFKIGMHEIRLLFFLSVLLILVSILKYKDEVARKMRNAFYGVFVMAILILVVDYPSVYHSMIHHRLMWLRVHTIFMVWEIYFLALFVQLIVFKKTKWGRTLISLNLAFCLFALFFPYREQDAVLNGYFLCVFGVWGLAMLGYGLYELVRMTRQYRFVLKQFYWPALFISWVFALIGFKDVFNLLNGRLPDILPLSPDNQFTLIFPLGITLIFYDQLQNKKLEETHAEQESEARIGRAVRQVAHDIKSPLVALESGLTQIENIPLMQLTLLRKATNRIHDIARGILEQHREKIEDGSGLSAPTFIYPLVQQIVGEKKLLEKHGPSFQLQTDLNDLGQFPFVNIAASDFQRVFSNMLNNAIEASSPLCMNLIRISLQVPEAGWLAFVVEDRGRGIPLEMQERVFEKGFSHGKPQGSGLGLSHAKAVLESCGGRIELTSNSKGTRVCLWIPLQGAPSAYCQDIDLSGIEKILVVDDDATIHDLWAKRLGGVKIPVEYFLRPPSNQTLAPHTLCLFDFEFKGLAENGIECIRRLYRADCRFFLVTGNYHEKRVQDACTNLNIGLIPKDIIECVGLKGKS